MVPGAGVGQAGLWAWLVWGRSVGFEGGEMGFFFTRPMVWDMLLWMERRGMWAFLLSIHLVLMRKVRPVSSQNLRIQSECTVMLGCSGGTYSVYRLTLNSGSQKVAGGPPPPPPEQNSGREPQQLALPQSPPGHDQTTHRIHQDPCSRLKPIQKYPPSRQSKRVSPPSA